MAAETVPPPSYDAQHHDEYIDYSEDDTAGPTVTAKGSNHSSFSANAHFVTDAPNDAETSLELETEVQAEVETDYVANDTHPESTDQEPGVVKVDDAALVKRQGEGELDNQNEINWEDGPDEGQAANPADAQSERQEGDWQLGDEAVQHMTSEAQPTEITHADDGPETLHEDGAEGYDDTVDALESFDDNTQDSADVDSYIDGQAVQTQDAEPNNNSHEVDYFEDGNTAAGATVDAAEAQAENHSAHQEGHSSAHSDQDTDDQTMDAGAKPFPKQEPVNEAGEANVDGVSTVELIPANDEQGLEAVGEDALIYDPMDFEDEAVDDDQSPASMESPSNEGMEIPVITVSYKGIDYPFFYNSPDSENKECFFDDLSLLHCKMEGVLAGFRRELANELGPHDELVFQIDELGLEFAESTQPDMFSDITLGQVISVFDSLVKNQDPDASKPLYANLLTRPNCKKRWLSLVDDAYNGKGLDEVGYFFASQAHSELAEPEILDDEPGMVGEEDNADASAWPNSPVESEHSDEDVTDHSVIDGQDPAGDQTVENQPAVYDAVEVDQANDDGGGAIEEAAANEDENPAAIDGETFQSELDIVEDANMETDEVDPNISLTDQSAAMENPEAAPNSTGINVDEPRPLREENVPEIDHLNPLVTWETEPADLLDTGADEQPLNDQNNATFANQFIDTVDDTSASKVTPNTSATSTLNGDEVTVDNNDLDLNADILDNEDACARAVTQPDELEEIDWREFPGQGDDEIPQSPPVAGKRQRSDVDDLLADGAEKDVKRRRP
ncbi:hypothetical protein CTRI78_v007329 [Colletotrichum trifolii]|uniref:Uncharacterized protein n=1 Tax=Colletotrichum trifolii TaxID=5466 RepID=A0A4R8R6G6_COLTR|nr:hypothetical protein CTRI78_v007329 [Colletotrichum trifolii]